MTKKNACAVDLCQINEAQHLHYAKNNRFKVNNIICDTLLLKCLNLQNELHIVECYI